VPGGGPLRELPVPRPGAGRMAQELVERIPGLAYSHLVGLFRQVSRRDRVVRGDTSAECGPVDPQEAAIEEELVVSILEEVLAVCGERGAGVVAVLVDISDEHLQMIKKLLTRRGIMTVLIPAKRERPDLYYKVDGHWNTAGHRFAAERVLEAIDPCHLRP